MTLVPKDQTPPADGSGLWEPLAIPLPDWGAGVRIETQWRTTVSASRTAAEHRASLSDRPARLQALRLRGIQDDAPLFILQSLRWARARTLWPLFSDGTDLLGRVSASLPIYRTSGLEHRRFAVGSRVIALIDEGTAMARQHATRAVVGISGDDIELDAPFEETYSSTPEIVSSTWASFIGISAFTASPTVTAQEGDIVVFAVTMRQTASSPTMTLVDLELEVDSVGEDFLAIEETGEVAPAPKIHPSAFHNPMHLRVAWVRISSALAGKSLRAVWEWSSAGTGEVQTGATIVRGCRNFAPVVDTASGTTPMPGTTTNISTDPPMAGNLWLGFAGCAVSATTFTWTNPGSPTEQHYLGSAGFAPTGLYSHVVVGGDLPTLATTVASGRGVIAVALVLQQREDLPSLSRGLLFPAIEAETSLSHSADALTDRLLDTEIVLDEKGGIGAIPAVSTALEDLSIPTFQGHPVLQTPPDWGRIRVGVSRPGERSSLGLGSTLTAHGDRGGLTFLLPAMAASRGEAWPQLRLFDARRGRAFPFWLMSPTAPFTVRRIEDAGETLVLREEATAIDWSNLTVVACRHAGETSMHAVTVSTPVGDERFLTLSPALPTTSLAAAAVSSGHLCRFDSDAQTETWRTDRVMTQDMECIELVAEDEIAAGIEPLATSVGDPWSPDSDFDFCACQRCGQSEEGCCVCTKYGVIMRIADYLPHGGAEFGQECPADCPLQNECVFFLDFVSCIEGVARWEGPLDTWAELDTETAEWSWSTGSASCVGEIIDEIPAPCALFPGVCDDLPSQIIESSCSGYSVREICSPFGDCRYARIFSLEAQGSGPASEACADAD